jgi:hypothetical protein
MEKKPVLRLSRSSNEQFQRRVGRSAWQIASIAFSPPVWYLFGWELDARIVVDWIILVV